eukprot:scaffold8247_cov258-Pinguiococcus_pyrenoidosus.AAC.3
MAVSVKKVLLLAESIAWVCRSDRRRLNGFSQDSCGSTRRKEDGEVWEALAESEAPRKSGAELKFRRQEPKVRSRKISDSGGAVSRWVWRWWWRSADCSRYPCRIGWLRLGLCRKRDTDISQIWSEDERHGLFCRCSSADLFGFWRRITRPSLDLRPPRHTFSATSSWALGGKSQRRIPPDEKC